MEAIMGRRREKIEKEMANVYDSAAEHATVELLLDIRELLEKLLAALEE
jgi:hypothetical protein